MAHDAPPGPPISASALRLYRQFQAKLAFGAIRAGSVRARLGRSLRLLPPSPIGFPAFRRELIR
jgi:hypothetical protein